MTFPLKEGESRIQKRILIISALDFWSMGNGKGGPALWRTLKGYADRGWEVFFITSNRLHEATTKLPENIYVLRFDAPWLKRLLQIKKVAFFANILWWVYFQITAFVKAQRIRSKHRIDVVYGYEIYGVPVAKVLSKLWRVPMVSRFQGTSFEVAWKTKRFRYVRAWTHLLGLRIPADLVIMTNDGTQGDKVLKQLGIDMTRVKFWLNGVDWELFKNLPNQEQARKILDINVEHVLLTISRLASWKRVDRAIRALPAVLQAYPNTLLVIVGDGPERKKLERLVSELGVKEHVRFEGAVPHREIPQYLAAADIFLSLYDWSNVGNPLLEAMMAGKCIVTLNNGDTGKFIKDEHNGILLEYGELPKLSEVIKDLLADEERRKRLGANARKFAEEHFWSWEERMEAEVRAVEALLR
jgi:glycosyltransferase involved in cell wall biosynthesis